MIISWKVVVSYTDDVMIPRIRRVILSAEECEKDIMNENVVLYTFTRSNIDYSASFLREQEYHGAVWYYFILVKFVNQ
jgi:hypothetical protein